MIKNYFFKAMLTAVVCGAAALGGGCSSSENNDTPDPDDGSIAAKSAHVSYFKADNLANYYLKLSTTELDSDGKAKGAGDIYYFDLYSALPQSGAIRMPAAGTYTLNATGADAAGTINAGNSFKEPYTVVSGTPSPGDAIDYTEAKVVISQSGNSFSVVAEVTLKTGEKVKIKASNIAGIVPTNELEEDIELLAETAEALYVPIPNTEYTGYLVNFYTADESEKIAIQFVSAETPFKNGIAEDDYSTMEVMGPGYAFPGEFDEEFQEPIGCYYTNNDGVYGYLTDCEISVIKNADGTYTISAMGMTENGHMVATDFEGEIPLESAAVTNLTEDVEMDLTAVSKGMALYFGNLYGNGTGVWLVSLDARLANKDALVIQLSASSPNSTDIPTGTFTCNTNGSAGTFLPGGLNEENKLVGSAFLTYNASADDASRSAAIYKGTYTIAATAPNYTITADLYDGNLNHLTGSWSGALESAPGKTSSASKVAMLASSKKLAAKMIAHKHSKLSSFIR